MFTFSIKKRTNEQPVIDYFNRLMAEREVMIEAMKKAVDQAKKEIEEYGKTENKQP